MDQELLKDNDIDLKRELRQIADAFARETYIPMAGQIRSEIEEIFIGYGQYVYEDLLAAGQEGNLTVAVEDNHIVSIIRIEKIDQPGGMFQGSGPVLELGRAYTMPELRGKGMYRKLRAEALQGALEKYGKLPIITATSSDLVKKMSLSEGGQQISFAEYLRIKGVPVDRIEEVAPDRDEKGFVGFVFP
jgi:predicted GNAT family N-acyltransferase